MKTLEDLTRSMEHEARVRTFTKWIRAVGVGDFEGIADRDLEAFRKAAVAAVGPNGSLEQLRHSREFVTLVERRTVLGQLPGTLKAPPFTGVPQPVDEPEAEFVADGAPIPVASLSFTSPTTDVAKIALIVGLSKELTRSADPRALDLIQHHLIRGLRLAEDRKFLDANPAVLRERPAGLLYGLSPVGGGSPSSLADDLEELVTAVRDGDADSPAFVLSRRGAAYLASLRTNGVPEFPQLGILGGNIIGIPAIISRAAGNKLILVDGSAVAVVDEGMLVERAENAAVRMDTAPGSGHVQVVSGFQTNTTFVRLVRCLSWSLLTDDCVAYLELPIGGSPA